MNPDFKKLSEDYILGKNLGNVPKSFDDVQRMCIEFGTQMYNKALDDAIKNAEVLLLSEYVEYVEIDSIKKLKV